MRTGVTLMLAGLPALLGASAGDDGWARFTNAFWCWLVAKTSAPNLS